ncbi:MAG: PBP1A family penicillin-binding protein [Chloroflexi bacterium]|jgi:1A family penicillin-binding protein|nr:PBP1A family penicillin-binding protein [Chloroflexota bacterium]
MIQRSLRSPLAKIGLSLLGLLLVIGLALWLWIGRDLPSPEDLETYTSAPSSKILDRHGRLLFEIPPPSHGHGALGPQDTGRHTPVPLAEIPQAMIWATIATEDATFYQNPGMDAAGILRALWINVRGGEVLAGGSTITQQLVRTVLFDPEERVERTLRRKLRELVLAVRITRHYTKDEILALYLNESYYGHLAYGVEAAAQAYYGKHVRDLDLAECAMLAGLPQAPAIYNPLENLTAAKERQAVVLDLMAKQQYITAEEAALAKEEPLAFAASHFPIRAPHFVMYVRGLLERELGLATLQAGGLTIHTTLDIDLNDTARALMQHRLAQLAACPQQDDCPPGGHNVRNAALLALDPQTGEVLAMVGSPDYFSARIDGAVNGATVLRQPGSAIKPITYAAAFATSAAFATGDFTPATMMLDVRTSFVTREGASYVPLNYDLTFRGPVRLREALASSYNLIAVKVLDAIGIETMTSLARRMGITTFDDPDRLGLAVTLGGGEVRLLELASAYAAFANGGQRVAPVTVRRVENAEGEVIWSARGGLGERVLDPRVAYLITDILSDDLARVPTFGEGSVLNLAGRPAAVKTGTTTDFRDNWTVGYTPELVAGVWVGNADNEAMRQVTGISGAAPIWHDFMTAALKGAPVRAFPRPDGLVEAEVCALSGLLPGPACPHRVRELFIEGTAPTRTCEVHRRIDGTLYTILPPEAQAWAREHNLPQPEIQTDAAPLQITAPDQGASYQIDPGVARAAQKIVIAAAAGRPFATVQLHIDGELLAVATRAGRAHLHGGRRGRGGRAYHLGGHAHHRATVAHSRRCGFHNIHEQSFILTRRIRDPQGTPLTKKRPPPFS